MIKTKITFEIYRSRNGWRWRARHINGKVLASGESYVSKWIMRRSLDNFIAVIATYDFAFKDLTK